MSFGVGVACYISSTVYTQDTASVLAFRADSRSVTTRSTIKPINRSDRCGGLWLLFQTLNMTIEAIT